MPKLLCIHSTKGISQTATAFKMRRLLAESGLSQRTVCHRMKIYPDRLCNLLKARRYLWSEDVAQRFLEAIK